MTAKHMTHETLVLSARYLLTGPNTIIDNGAVVIGNGKIIFAGGFKDFDGQEGAKIIDLGNSAIIPGLINAHTHLELSRLKGCINYNGNFADWVKQIIEAKKKWEENEYRLSIREGIARSIEAGTTTIADITRNSYAFDELINSKLRKFVFYELIDFNPSTAEDTLENFKKIISGIENTPLLSIGMSPHAPYTVSRELYKRCSVVSGELDIKIATHLSESMDEIEFLTNGTGSLAGLLESRGMLNSWKHPGVRPITYLSKMGVLNNSWLLIHCNYITVEEIADIKKSNSSVVFCPGSHKFFGHRGHPFRKYIDHGINVALGTDSLASNETLSILDEMKSLYEEYKDLKPQSILHMGTIAGAIALGLEDKIGRVGPGFDADITVIKLPEERSGNIYDEIFSRGSECIFTVVSGSICYDKDKLAPSSC